VARSNDGAGGVGLGNAELHSLILSWMTEGVCLVRLVRLPDEAIVFTNPAFDAMFGFDRGELIGKPITVIRHSEARTAITDEAVTTGQGRYEILNVKKDGSTIWCRGIASSFEHPELGTVRVLVKEDISEQRAARIALRASEQKYREMVETTRDGICVTDAEERFIYVNRRCEEMLGYEPDELLGKPINTIVDPEDLEPSAERTEQRRRGIVGDGEVMLRHKRGHAIWIHYGSTPRFDDRNAYAGTLRMFTDLTALKRATDAAEKLRDRLIVADRMASLGTLAAGVGHEINNPLATVLANLEMMTEELANPDELARMIANTRVGAERIKRIVGALRTFARPDEERRVVLDVRAVIDLALEMVGNQVVHRARLVKDYHPVAQVEADQGRLTQVFINLLVNAAQAIDEGRAEANAIQIITRDDAEWVVIEVHDTGRGIAADVAPRIFDPFFTTKAVGEGAGLGLAICHSIVTSLGGQIAAERSANRGSVFRVKLPASTRPPVAAIEVTPPPAVAKRRGRVLVIDDDLQLAKTLGRALSAHDTTLAFGGAEALAILSERNDFDVILCDLMMPEVTGMELYERVATERPEVARRIIFMTGGAFTTAARTFLDTVQNECVAKPFDLVRLRALVASRVG